MSLPTDTVSNEMFFVLTPLLFGISVLRTVARASRFEIRASINGMPVEVPDVH